MNLREQMTRLRDALAESPAIAATGRPVTCDPRDVVPPCVLIEPPRLENADTILCGPFKLGWSLYVIGLPGAWAELEPLSDLLSATIQALDGIESVEWSRAELSHFTPGGVGGGGEPSLAYTITCEEYEQ